MKLNLLNLLNLLNPLNFKLNLLNSEALNLLNVKTIHQLTD